METLAHIEEGQVYHDGEQRQLYDVSDPASVEAVLFQKCITWSTGPLDVKGCLNTDPLSFSLSVTLLGVTLASCTLSAASPSCTVGGSVDGFKAELTVTLSTDPLSITITGTLCAPIVGCTSFNVTIPLGS